MTETAPDHGRAVLRRTRSSSGSTCSASSRGMLPAGAERVAVIAPRALADDR